MLVKNNVILQNTSIYDEKIFLNLYRRSFYCHNYLKEITEKLLFYSRYLLKFVKPKDRLLQRYLGKKPPQ